MARETSPTARALLALELLQGSPGITAERLADKLGVSERAARRYVGILREAGIPIESARGPYGGYRVGRGLRLPPLVFSADEALGLVMAVLDGHHDAERPADPVGSALGKIVRALPEPVAAQAEAVRRATAPAPDRGAARPDPGTTSALVRGLLRPAAGARATTAPRRAASGASTSTRGRWSSATAAGTCCAGRTPADGRRAYRIDRVLDVDAPRRDLRPPVDLDPVAVLEEHLAVGWEYDAEVVIDAPLDVGRPVRAARPRPARTHRRRHLPADRQHQQPGLVRRAAGRDPRGVPDPARSRGAVGRSHPRRAPACGGRADLGSCAQSGAMTPG